MVPRSIRRAAAIERGLYWKRTAPSACSVRLDAAAIESAFTNCTHPALAGDDERRNRQHAGEDANRDRQMLANRRRSGARWRGQSPRPRKFASMDERP